MHQSLSIEPIRRVRTKGPRVYQNARHAQRKRAQAAGKGGHAGQAGQAGMTLLEMMIVLAILALVMGVVIGPAVINKFRDARKGVAAIAVDKYVNEAFPAWVHANPGKGCPESLAALAPYMNKKSLEDP